MVLTFDEVGERLDAMAEEFPPVFYRELNGGISLLPEAVEDPEFPPGEIYIMGEYCDDQMGRYIQLYYGSFAALAERKTGRWKRGTTNCTPRWPMNLRTILKGWRRSLAWTARMRKNWLPFGLITMNGIRGSGGHKYTEEGAGAHVRTALLRAACSMDQKDGASVRRFFICQPLKEYCSGG